MTRKKFLQTAAGVAGAMAVRASESTPEVYPVPPLARKNDSKRSLDLTENDRMLRFLKQGGIRHVIYGGNAFLYHTTLAEYRELTEWLGGKTGEFSITAGIGPSYGRAMDQAPLIRRHKFAAVLALPCADPRDAAGMESGYREIAESCGVPLSLYIKDEANFGPDKEAGLDVVGRLIDAKVATSIKYAVVRKDPADDAYLRSLLRRVDGSRIISGIGERPAIVHVRDFKLSGFTTGSGCLAPKASQALLQACLHKDYEKAERIRSAFIPLEDLRDAWGPPRVLHSAVALAGLSATGPIPPFVSGLNAAHLAKLKPVAKALLEADSSEARW